MVNPLAKTWMCSLCGQGFTRRTSARRHNDHLHSAQSIIMRPMEYLVGRLQGHLPSPQDPLNYRRPGPHHLRDEPSMVAHDNYEKPNQPPIDNFSRSLNPNYYDSFSSFEPKYPKNSRSPASDQLSIGIKLKELAVLLNKHCTSDEAMVYLAWTNMNLSAGNVNILDTNLNLFRSLDGSKAYWTRKNPGMNDIGMNDIGNPPMMSKVTSDRNWCRPLYKSGAIWRMAA